VTGYSTSGEAFFSLATTATLLQLFARRYGPPYLVFFNDSFT
jgi:hypothetical protein